MSEKKELDKIREKIDELDAELLQLLNRRSSLAMEAGKRKKEERKREEGGRRRERTVLIKTRTHHPRVVGIKIIKIKHYYYYIW